jgi:hypothetical protein
MQRSSTRRLAYALALISCAGCRSSGPSAEESIYLDPSGAATVALELYDANGDQLLDAAELEKCPPLAAALASFDVNGDRKLASDEIVGRLMRITMSGSSLTDASCTVLLAGRPLADAQVRLESVFVKGEATWAGEGVTNAQGVAKISLPADKLPAEASGGMPVGIYRVEITHPQQQLASRYNTASELGWEIDSSSGAGASVRFDLKSN